MDNTCRLIIFTRYPQPGETKTRLIPKLGAEGAAMLQKHLTEHTLDTVREFTALCSQHGILLNSEVRFTGSDRPSMQAWLGQQWNYSDQGAGSLGDRLLRAFQFAVSTGDRAIAIGIDCPGITAQLLWAAFANLQTHDLVLGPAADGGYYLIGMKQVIPDLFAGIAWSTEQVFTQTVAIAHRFGLKVATLETLTDIDYPDDLTVWYQICADAKQP